MATLSYRPGHQVPRQLACLGLLALSLLMAGRAGAAPAEALAACSKCVSPQVFSKSGTGSAQAQAQARITPAAIAQWCAARQPGDATCVRQQTAASDLTRTYRASANCPAGRITPIDGNTYTRAGVWDAKGVGGGRSRWRDAAGKIVGRDDASGGLAISQQWELLCPVVRKPARQPGVVKPATPAAAATPPTAEAAKPALPPGEFSVGQAVLARYGSASVGARIAAVQRHPGSPTSYEVVLENGQRRVLPADVLRAR